MPYHIATDTVYPNWTAAARATKIAGLSAETGPAYGIIDPPTAPKPSITATQRLRPNVKPTKIDGEWVFEWTIIDMDIADVRAAMPPLSTFQFAMALAGATIITPAEAEAWAVEGTLPASALSAINNHSTWTDAEKLGARIKARKPPTSIHRLSEIIDLLQAQWEMTPEQVDALFIAGAGIPE